MSAGIFWSSRVWENRREASFFLWLRALFGSKKVDLLSSKLNVSRYFLKFSCARKQTGKASILFFCDSARCLGQKRVELSSKIKCQIVFLEVLVREKTDGKASILFFCDFARCLGQKRVDLLSSKINVRSVKPYWKPTWSTLKTNLNLFWYFL